MALPLQAAELEGVRLEDQIRVDGQELQLNGLALRTRFIFKVYVAGLYLPAKTTTAQAAIESRSATRIILVMMRDATADQFVESTDTAMRANNSEAQIAAVKAQVEAGAAPAIEHVDLGRVADAEQCRLQGDGVVDPQGARCGLVDRHLELVVRHGQNP